MLANTISVMKIISNVARKHLKIFLLKAMKRKNLPVAFFLEEIFGTLFPPAHCSLSYFIPWHGPLWPPPSTWSCCFPGPSAPSVGLGKGLPPGPPPSTWSCCSPGPSAPRVGLGKGLLVLLQLPDLVVVLIILLPVGLGKSLPVPDLLHLQPLSHSLSFFLGLAHLGLLQKPIGKESV